MYSIMCILEIIGEKVGLKKFRFTLESVLTVRKHALEDERIKLASIISVLNQQQEVLETMNFEYANLERESEKYLSMNFNPQVISNYRAFSLKLVGDIKVQKEIIERTRLDLKNRQQLVKDAYIKVQTLEKLKEKQKELYFKDLEREEFKQIDDIVNSKRVIA